MGMELLNFEPQDPGQAYKENGRWVISHDGMVMTLSEWAKYTGINRGTLYSRLARGWTIDDVLYRPVRGQTRLIENFFMALAS